ncbi:InlB B-repeat-containing protein, partial [Peptoniphilus catoniae]|uniref:InlB B-repeat-containing protein n=1 Tax=Peptoniphilus catoniae TaxID=1660341 RepID=UPI0015D5CEEF
LDVSNNPALEYLYCGATQLTNLDVSNNPALKYLNCGNNRLKKLDVSNSPALQTLHCDANFLTNLDVSKNPALEYLYCEANRLTNLDVSKNTALVNLFCYNQTYDVKVKISDMKIPYADFPGSFDITKATRIVGANSDFIVDATKPSIVTYNYKTGYNPKYFNVTLNITYDAYTVTFNTNGGSAVSAQTIKTGEHAQKPEDPTKDGYTFAGWYKDAGLTTPFNFATETINADITLYAKWNENPPAPTSYTVTFNTNGGSAVNQQTITAGGLVTKPADPTKDGYTFAGWYKDAGLTTPFDFVNETINADTTIYAKWTQNAVTPTPEQFTITFDKNGGTGTMADVTKNKGESFTLPACTFTPPVGKEFKA